MTPSPRILSLRVSYFMRSIRLKPVLLNISILLSVGVVKVGFSMQLSGM
jgi:hypothetical protein